MQSTVPDIVSREDPHPCFAPRITLSFGLGIISSTSAVASFSPVDNFSYPLFVISKEAGGGIRTHDPLFTNHSPTSAVVLRVGYRA